MPMVSATFLEMPASCVIPPKGIGQNRDEGGNIGKNEKQHRYIHESWKGVVPLTQDFLS